MKYVTPQLETERLILKRGKYDDYAKVYEYDFIKLRDVAGEFEFVKLDLDRIAGFDTYADCDDVLDWVIYLKENGEPIGNIVADRVVKDINAIELAYNLHPNYWGNKYMREALISVMNHLFSLGFSNVLCGYEEGNVKSKKLIENLGFEMLSIEENAWQKNDVPITNYHLIMSKENFDALYNKKHYM